MKMTFRAFGRFFFACVFLLSSCASAAQVEVGLGLAQSNTHGDGAGFPRGGDPWPPIWRGQTVLMLTYTF